MTDTATWIRRRETFYVHALGPFREPSVYHWNGDRDPHVDVYSIGPRPGRDHEILITGGLADRALPGLPAGGTHPRRFELLLRLAVADAGGFRDRAARLLEEVARLPFCCDVRLRAGLLIRGAQAVSPGSLLHHGLLVPCEEPSLAGFLVESEEVVFLELNFITEAERAFGILHGGLALRDRLTRCGIGPVTNLRRPSIL